MTPTVKELLSQGFISRLTRDPQANGCPVCTYSAEVLLPAPPVRTYPIATSWIAASGKHWTPERARAACVYEAAERYSATHHGNEPLISASYTELGDKAVSPDTLLHYSPRQYASRDMWNTAFGPCQYIPNEWHADDPIEWVACQDIRLDSLVYVPAGFCYLRYAPPEPKILFPNESTGCAAGPTIQEATVRAFLEVVERDAVALWWYNRTRRPGLDIESFGNGRVIRTREYLRSQGRTLYALDLTTDCRIPVIAAISSTQGGDAVMFGFAADFDPGVALERAVLELVQILGPAHTWTKNGMLEHYKLAPDRKAWVEYARLDDHSYLLPADGRSMSLSDFKTAVPKPEMRLQDCIERAKEIGARILVADLTREHVGVPVVRAIVPGFRSSWAQLGPGRLFDAPVHLGWRDRPCREDELNSFPFFL